MQVLVALHQVDGRGGGGDEQQQWGAWQGAHPAGGGVSGREKGTVSSLKEDVTFSTEYSVLYCVHYAVMCIL